MVFVFLCVRSQKFNKAAADVQNLKSKPSNEDLLEIYALFKQGQVGDINTGERRLLFCLLQRPVHLFVLFADRPGMLDLKGKAKWDAWNSKKGTSKDAAKEAYIKKAQELIDSIGLK